MKPIPPRSCVIHRTYRSFASPTPTSKKSVATTIYPMSSSVISWISKSPDSHFNFSFQFSQPSNHESLSPNFNSHNLHLSRPKWRSLITSVIYTAMTHLKMSITFIVINLHHNSIISLSRWTSSTAHPLSASVQVTNSYCISTLHMRTVPLPFCSSLIYIGTYHYC